MDNDSKSRKKSKKSMNWAATITVITFFVALVLGFFSDILSKNLNMYLALIILLFIILTGITFDIMGLSIATADEKVFHAMASNKVKGARQALYLLKNMDKVTNLFNDVVGDVAGIISGATGSTIGAFLIMKMKTEGLTKEVFIFSLVSAVIAALTVGGKAMGKKIAIANANSIVFVISKIMAWLRIEK